MTRKITLLFILFISTTLYSQVGIGTDTPNENSVLDIKSETKGVLITRVALTATNNASPLSQHVAGMIVYNITPSGVGDQAVYKGFYYNNGTEWIRLEPLTTQIGDIKHSLLTEDHNGWYLLDGRNTNLLPTKAQTNASTIGFTTQIPDARDRILKGKSALESLMDTGGNNTVNLSQTNLPNVTFTGSTNSTGDHNHNHDDKYHGTPESLNLVTGLLGILSGVVLNILNNDVGSDTVSTTVSNTSSNGNHNHTATVNTGGSAAPLDKVSHMVTNTFVYLGK
ncbi:hypothetical protein ABGT15_07980 [Flavobacterium enshiense]|uniref:hypothetical protein n=1 Tax=Flavobacterium enshiense TaxID=1341165 RepID=UPI00345CDA6B